MIDIKFKAESYPANALSNFCPYPFVLDGVQVSCMEAFLQALKYPSEKKRMTILQMPGKEAKAQSKKSWHFKLTHKLYWKNTIYNLYDDDLQDLLDRAYLAMYNQNEAFQNSLDALGDEEICHSIGTRRSDRTILSEWHFIVRLNMLRMIHKSRKEGAI